MQWIGARCACQIQSPEPKPPAVPVAAESMLSHYTSCFSLATGVIDYGEACHGLRKPIDNSDISILLRRLSMHPYISDLHQTPHTCICLK